MDQDPNAQGPVVPAPVADSQTQQAAPPAIDPGIQKRIDELTAARHDAEKRALEAQNFAMKVAMEQTARQQPVAPPAPDLTAQYGQTVDPNVIAMMKQVTADIQAKADANLETRTRQLRAQYGAAQIRVEAQQLKGIPPEVGQRAAELYQQAQLAGNNASEGEALRYAVGDWMLKQQALVAPVYGQTGRQLAPDGQPITQSNYVPARQVKSFPSNWDSLTDEQQLAQMEKDGLADRGFGE